MPPVSPSQVKVRQHKIIHYFTFLTQVASRVRLSLATPGSIQTHYATQCLKELTKLEKNTLEGGGDILSLHSKLVARRKIESQSLDYYSQENPASPTITVSVKSAYLNLYLITQYYWVRHLISSASMHKFIILLHHLFSTDPSTEVNREITYWFHIQTKQ